MISLPGFDLVAGILVLLNAITLGYQTDFMARHSHLASPPMFLQILELIFCGCFTIEISLRMFAHGCEFFVGRDWRWNLLDIILVAIQLSEEITMQVFSLGWMAKRSQAEGILADLTVMRLLRVLRLVRIVRLIRVMRNIGELRTLVMSIMTSMRSLCWACSLLFLTIYILAVYYTQVVTDYRSKHNLHSKAAQSGLIQYFGTLDSTMLTLFESVTGGVDWDDSMRPLSEISPLLTIIYSLYIAFVLLAMMNVVTSVFTETAVLSAKKDADVYMVNHARKLFSTLDIDDSGMVTWEEIKAQMGTPEMKQYFQAIDVGASEAEGLFRLLDLKNTGYISAEDFLTGCIRIRGPARALEIMLLMQETGRMAKRLKRHNKDLEQFFATVGAQSLPHQRQSPGSTGCDNSTTATTGKYEKLMPEGTGTLVCRHKHFSAAPVPEDPSSLRLTASKVWLTGAMHNSSLLEQAEGENKVATASYSKTCWQGIDYKEELV